ncbi:MAG TPA: ABC transporter permease [Puia sp.]|uniref:ABC transporter permease n=1 Tax=Puia sp. TaxID=2045100 RepID=UPI002C9B48DC|nr:ABC transporter permease [Puia sp.]HVU93621.1 ABC transporter permease [Puia sp.]
MIRNYFKTAWRNILRNKLYSGINVLGLTIGLAVGMLILLWVQDESSYDGFHHRAANIYRVNSAAGKGSLRVLYETTPAAVAAAALKEIPGVVNAVRTFPDWRYSIFSYGDKLFEQPVAIYADSNLLQMLDFRLVAGDARQLWPNLQSVVITESTARKYFGGADPMGKMIMGDHKDPFVVSGVLADFPDNSSIKADLLFPIATFRGDYNGTGYWPTLESDWGNFGYLTLLELQPGVSPKEVGGKLLAVQMRQAPQIKASAAEMGFELQPLNQIHLRKADGSAPLLQTVRIFEWIAVFILLIASINYVNLSTARAMLRAREVGVRKIMGAAKRQLFTQFVIETAMFYLVSLLLAFGLIFLVTPAYNSFAYKHFRLDITDTSLWKVVATTGVGVLLASAVYPALLLSAFEPLRALKGKIMQGVGNVAFRKLLVTTQFVFSVGLIIGTLVIDRQLSFVRERDPGYNRSQVFTFYGLKMRDHSRAVSDQLRKEPAIKEVSVANDELVDVHNSTGDNDWDGKPANSMFIINLLNIDEHFLPMMKMSLEAGENFSGRPVDSIHYILNETAVRQMGITHPVGKRFRVNDKNGTIIGVVKDFNFASLHTAIGPMVLRYRPTGGVFYVKTAGHGASRAIAAAQKLWRQYNPGMPFDYNFLDGSYEEMYRSDMQTGDLFTGFAGIAIFLSCLGLFGLATYTAQVRTREIGIRKVLGASVTSIVALLSRDFLWLVLIAIVIASPLAAWGMDRWLQDFVYRTDVAWWVFAVAGGAALGFALLTIGWRAVRAALANPVDSLRAE